MLFKWLSKDEHGYENAALKRQNALLLQELKAARGEAKYLLGVLKHLVRVIRAHSIKVRPGRLPTPTPGVPSRYWP